MKRQAVLWPLVLCLAVCGAWMWSYNKHSVRALKEPFQYGFGEAGSADALQVLPWLQAASEFDFIPFCDRTNHRLGAPSNANWNDFPMYDAPLLFLFGIVARYTDLLTAANLIILFGHLTSAAGFYFACRLLRLNRVWASAGALIWSFSCYHAWRGLGHVCLAYDYAVPIAVVCSWLAIAQLENRGFSAIYFDRGAFLDHAESAVKALAACGRTEVIEDELHEQVCVVLKTHREPAGAVMD